MTTAPDTNVLSAIFGNEATAVTLARLLFETRRSGQLIICGAAYAELLGNPRLPESVLEGALARASVSVDWALDEPVWRAAGTAFKSYVARREAGGSLPRRLLADFILGAHANSRADALMTLDSQHYRLAFPALKLIAPV